jgi:hypothetical protein
MDRIDAITTLKRCLNQRLKQIEAAYKLKVFLGQITDTLNFWKQSSWCAR